MSFTEFARSQFSKILVDHFGMLVKIFLLIEVLVLAEVLILISILILQCAAIFRIVLLIIADNLLRGDSPS